MPTNADSSKDQSNHGCLSKMLPLSQSWYYWAMVALLLAQVVLSVNYHILVCNMPIANTLLLLVIMAHHGYALGDQARPLFHRICGCVAFIAVLFVNTTHALELLTDYTDGHSHSHGDEDHDDHDHHSEEHGFGFVPKQYIIVSIFDVALKCLVLALGHIPSMGLHPIPRLILHTLSPTIVIGMYVAGLAIPAWFGKSWFWQHVDPVVAVITTILFFLLIIPACGQNPNQVGQTKLLHDILKFVRMSQVVVEPSFLDATEIGRPWVGCVGATCFRQDRGCCKIQDNQATV
ncbi:hypothetical protein ANCCAN_19969 [Ancylostoma caninum]|uniref:Cation diffusion facilitator family transporter n=1 Tax=Ancylostoma caninum TaxID=29170 RepID=A0A368FPS9_ANCCA|nr:hypothetical protein ANCCAN_19969 [Ancylostoma caninum]